MPCVGGSSGLRRRSAESGGACSLWSNQAQPKRTRAQKGDSRARVSYTYSVRTVSLGVRVQSVEQWLSKATTASGVPRVRTGDVWFGPSGMFTTPFLPPSV